MAIYDEQDWDNCEISAQRDSMRAEQESEWEAENARPLRAPFRLADGSLPSASDVAIAAHRRIQMAAASGLPLRLSPAEVRALNLVSGPIQTHMDAHYQAWLKR